MLHFFGSPILSEAREILRFAQNDARGRMTRGADALRVRGPSKEMFETIPTSRASGGIYFRRGRPNSAHTCALLFFKDASFVG